MLTWVVVLIASGVAYLLFAGTIAIVKAFGRVPEILRWLLFLPFSLVRALLIGGVIYAQGYLFTWLNMKVISIFAWPAIAYVLITTIAKTAPRAKRSIGGTIGILFVVLSIADVVTTGMDIVARIAQILIAALATYYVLASQIDLGQPKTGVRTSTEPNRETGSPNELLGQTESHGDVGPRE